MDNINLKSNAPKNVINVTSDSTIYYANVAKEAANSATQSAQLATEKAQIVQNGAQTSLNAINELKTSSLSSIETLADSSTSDITTLKNSAVSEINELKTSSLSSIETLADSSTSDINTLKTSSITEITSAKTTALDSITQAKTGALSSIESASLNFPDRDLSNITDDGKNVIRTLASENGSSSGGGGSWGSITGTLSDQTDLTTALSNKLNADYTNSTIPYVVETGDQTFFRYRRWSDGFLEQMGYVSLAENLSAWIAFPFPYEDEYYSCIVGANYPGVKYSIIGEQEKKAYSMWTYQKDPDKCGVTNYGPDADISWYVFGQGAST